jgi:hypothetical protein
MNRKQQEVGSVKTNRREAARAVGVALLFAALPALTACTSEVNGGLVILQNQVPESSDKGCVIPTKAQMIAAIGGVYDVDLDRPYPFYFYPLLRNDLPKTATPDSIEVNRIGYTGVEVKIIPPAGVVLPSTPECPTEFSYSAPAQETLFPGDEAPSAVQVLLPCHSIALRTLLKSGKLPSEVPIKVAVRALGKYAAGTVKSDPFEYVIRVCVGCLQRSFPGYEYPAIPACTSFKAGVIPMLGNACNPAQDQSILCCQASPTVIKCPAVGSEPVAP